MENLNTLINPIDQTQAHSSLKDTYGFVSSAELINAFKANGWNVTTSTVMKPRRKDKIGFQRHLIRLEHPDFPSIPGLTDDNASRVQLCLLNSHDGTTALRVFFGVIRFVCANGLISGTTVKDFRAVHSKNITNRLDNGIKYLMDGIPELVGVIQKLQNATFTEAAFNEFVKTLVDARLANVNKVLHVNYEDAFKIRRSADAATDAFTLVNRVQESLIRGGIRYQYEREIKDVNGNPLGTEVRQSSTRRLASVASQVNLNRLLWDKAVELAG